LLDGAERLTGELLTAVDGCPDFVQAFSDWARLPPNALAECKFRCILPGHEERRPSANLWRDRRGLYVYRDHHARQGRGSYCLAEVYAALISGAVRPIRAPELSRWKLRALAQFGFLPLASAELPELPAGASHSAKAAREGVKLLFAVRRLTEGDDITPFTRSFAHAWCGINEAEAAGAIAQLRKHGVIVKVGERPSSSGRAMNVYKPGEAR
jgi:hypothetical protein